MKTLIFQIAIALAIGAAAILGRWVIPFTWPLAIASTLIWVAALAATVLVHNWLKKIKNMTNVNCPSKPNKPAM